MDIMETILDKVCDNMKEYGEKLRKDGKLSGGDWEMLGHLVDIKKNILKTWKLEDEDGGYSQAGDWEAMGRINGRYGDGYDKGNSYANRGQHYVRGHYSRARGRDSMGRYSRGGGDLMEHMDMMMEEAETPQEKELIRRFKRELEKV